MGAKEIVEERLVFESEGLRLVGSLAYPVRGQPTRGVLLLAPHPHMGGRMDNNVIRHLARRFAEDGDATLRFDYRGVGESEIRLPPRTSLFDHFASMEAEQRYEELLPDAEAALAALRAAVGGGGVLVVGYSLGAVLAGMLASRCPVDGVVGISPPVARVSLRPYRGVAAPVVFVAGDADFAFDEARFRDELAALPPCEVLRLPGSDHFFRQEEERLYETLRRALGWEPGRATGAGALRRGPRASEPDGKPTEGGAT